MLPRSSVTVADRCRLAVVAVAPVSFVGGLAAMRFVLMDAGFVGIGTHGRSGLFLATAVVVFLSVSCAVAAGCDTRARTVAIAAFILNMIAAVLCSPITLSVLGFLDWAQNPSPFPVHGSAEAVLIIPVVLILAAVFGAIFSLPLGAAFSAFYASVLAAIAIVRERSGHAQSALSIGVVGLSWIVAGVVLSDFEGARDHLLGPLSPAHGLVILGVLAVGLGLVRLARMRRWLQRVARGAVPGWALSPPIDADAALVRLFPWRSRFGTLVRVVAADAEGPFRSTDTHVRVAR